MPKTRGAHRQEVPGAPTACTPNSLQDTLRNDGQMAMGVESEVVRTHGQEGLKGHDVPFHGQTGSHTRESRGHMADWP
jgi:hypothetical protein